MKFKLFKTISENLINKFTSKEIQYFTEQFNEYFKMEDYLFCYQMMDEGYKPSKFKIQELNQILLNKLDKAEYTYEDLINIKSLEPETRIISILKEVPDFDFYNSTFLDKSNKLIGEDLILNFFKEKKYKAIFLENYFKESIKHIKRYYLYRYTNSSVYVRTTNETLHVFKQNIKDLIYVTSVLIKNELINQCTIQEIKESFKSFIDLIESKTRENNKQYAFEQINKSMIYSFVKELSVYQINILNTGNQKEDLLRKLKSHEARKTPLAEEMQSLIVNKEYSINNLPKESKEKVDRITKLISSLNNKEVTEFVQERLPIIVKKYFSIDEDYRTSLKNVEGFNAQELMNQSLDNIEKIILAKKEDNNIELITEMSVENRSLKIKQI